MRKNDSDPQVRIYFESFLYRFSVEATESLLSNESKRFKSPLGRLFFQLLRQNTRGSLNLSRLFARFTKIAEGVDQLERRERGMLFVPKFQTWVAVCMSFLFLLVLPGLSNDLFPTFLSLKRYDLFAAGISFLTLGFLSLHWMCVQPRRHLKPYLELVFFMQFLSLFIESGLDLITSWYRALEMCEMNATLSCQLRRKDLSVEIMDEFLGQLALRLKAPWPEILVGILWAKTSGVGLSQYLQGVSERQSEILLSRWDEEIRRLSLTTLLPLGFLIFPSVLFLLVGPQFIQLVNL